MTIDEIVDEFLTQLRAGGQPSIEQFVMRCPSHAADLRRALCAVQTMEELADNVTRKNAGSGRLFDQGEVSDSVGDYQIVREIGRGGMGVVYEAVQQSLGRRVALKVLAHHFGNSEAAAERFQREAQTSAQMHHTNIVPVFEVGRRGKRVFYAMQLIEGPGLDQIIADLRTQQRRDGAINIRSTPDVESAVQPAQVDPKPTAKGWTTDHTSDVAGPTHYRFVANVGIQVADALSHAHSRGVVHRDIKPANLMQDAEGVIWVTDFGLAKTDADAITQSGELIGTIRYMSPERFSGICDERGDLYALGLTLYELLLLQPAFTDDERPQLLDSIFHHQPPRPRAIDRRIPVDLETVILKSIEKAPEDRYLSAEAMSNDLRRFLQGKPVLARRVTIAETFWRWSQRNRRFAAALAAITLLVFAVAVVASIAAVRESRLRSTAESQRDEIQQTLYISQMNQAGQLASEPGGIAATERLISHWLPSVASVDLRGWEWFYLDSLSRQEQSTLRGATQIVWSVSWEPNGKRLVSSANDGTLRFWDSESGQQTQVIKTASDRCVAWSPNGQFVASGGFRGQIEIWDVNQQSLIRTLPGPTDEMLSIDWSSDSKRLAISTRNGAARVWDLDRDELVWEHTGMGLFLHSIRWSPNDQWIALAGQTGIARLYHAASGELLHRIATNQGDLRSVCWSPDSSQFATAGRAPNVKVWNSPDGTPDRTIEGIRRSVQAIDWSPDGRTLAIADWDRVVQIRENGSRAKFPVQLLRGHSAGIERIAFSPDGRRIASASQDQTVKVWELSQFAPSRTINTINNYGLSAADVSPGGQWIAGSVLELGACLWDSSTGEYFQMNPADQQGSGEVTGVRFNHRATELATASHDQRIRIWNPDTRRCRLTLSGHQERVWSVSYSPDDSKIASASADRTVKVWDADTGAEIRTLPGLGHILLTIDWHPSNDWVAAGDLGGNVIVWNTATGAIIRRWKQHSQRVNCVRWSPEGHQLASSSHDQTIILWNPHSPDPVATLANHTGAVLSVSWNTHTDKPRMAAGCSNGTVKVWDLRSRQVTCTIAQQHESIFSVKWSDDGKGLLSASRDGSIRRYDASRSYRDHGVAFDADRRSDSAAR